VILFPARLGPIFSARPWGSLSLAPFFPEKSNLDEPLGEAWLTGTECRFASGPYEGQMLGDAWPSMPPEWAGTQVDRNGAFPLLVKFVFSEDKLSIQVHPDDEYAALHERAAGGRGKTEMWYAVRAQPGAEVMVGLKAGISAEKFRAAISDGTAELCLNRLPLCAGDAIFVPAGTVHTIGPGLVLCEIQEQSDLTYRVYDYDRRDASGRGRELHIAKALDVIRFGEQTGGKIEPAHAKHGPIEETFFAACRYFAMEKWEFAERVAAETSREHFELMIILEGSGDFASRGSRAKFAAGQVWMLPAALGAYQIEPFSPTALLRAYVPSDSGEFMRRLRERGIDNSVSQRLVHS
jgi:mannose-6-phosphate isomerase